MVAALLLGLESVVCLGLAAVEFAQTQSSRPVVGAGAGVLLVGYGALLLAAARGVLRGRRWARSPGVATQLLHLPLAWSLRGGAWEVAAALGAVSLATLVCLLLPSATAVFVPAADQAPDEG